LAVVVRVSVALRLQVLHLVRKGVKCAYAGWFAVAQHVASCFAEWAVQADFDKPQWETHRKFSRQT
jgi:hypothetical protein